MLWSVIASSLDSCAVRLTLQYHGPRYFLLSRRHPVIQKASFEVCRVFSDNNGMVPEMEALMAQSGKLFVVEYVWRLEGEAWQYHVVGVDTQARVVFCNTLGILPFGWKNKRSETSATHGRVVEQLRVHMHSAQSLVLV